MENNNDVCVICGGNGANNNAEPVAEGCCCDTCNSEVVNPARNKAFIEQHNRYIKNMAKAKQTIHYMVSVLMSDDFEEWMIDNWDKFSAEEEYSEIMRLYFNDTDVYYTTVPLYAAKYPDMN